MLVIVLAGVATLLAVAWDAYRRRRASCVVGAESADTFVEGEGVSAADHFASICMDSTDGGGGGGGD